MIPMKDKRPSVGAVVEVKVGDDPVFVAEVVGHHETTATVFLYEPPFSPIVEEWEGVSWRADPVASMERDIKAWDEGGSLAKWLVKKGWRR